MQVGASGQVAASGGVSPPSSSSSIEELFTQDKQEQEQAQAQDRLAGLIKNYQIYVRNADDKRIEYLAKILALVTVKLGASEQLLKMQQTWILEKLSSLVPISKDATSRQDEELSNRAKALITSMKEIEGNFQTWNEKKWTEQDSEGKTIEYPGIANDLKTLQQSKPAFTAIAKNLTTYKKKYEDISPSILALTPPRTDLLKHIDDRIHSDKKKQVSSDSLDTIASSIHLTSIELFKCVGEFHQRTLLFEETLKEIKKSFKAMNLQIKSFRYNFIYLSYLSEYKYFNDNPNWGTFMFGYGLNWYNHYIDNPDPSKNLVFKEEEEPEIEIIPPNSSSQKTGTGILLPSAKDGKKEDDKRKSDS